MNRVTVTQMLEATEAAIDSADRRWRRRRDVVLWLRGAEQLPSLGVSASQSRRADDGCMEYGYTLAQAVRIRDRLYAAFRDHSRSVS